MSVLFWLRHNLQDAIATIALLSFAELATSFAINERSVSMVATSFAAIEPSFAELATSFAINEGSVSMVAT